ncbi:MAG: DUF4160 domain-containing protein [Phycisphaerae bacterium]|nr:DUF4160 domain-containing protein [Phycisphaerae bacterium]NUQ47425.1 DUF4160 domain-containing protein [Phycisphaerae bacterium]
MPTIARIGPYRIYFYSHDRREPPHVHVDRDAYTAKFWLTPVELAWCNIGFRPKEWLTGGDAHPTRSAHRRGARGGVSGGLP